MREAVSQATWQTLAARLQQPACGVARTFPPPANQLSLLDALTEEQIVADASAARQGRELSHRIAGLVEQLGVFESISRCPIVALTGLLNAGKSSLLATYLSPENRRRVLRGLGNNYGTHRFVLWLPEIWWNDAELLNTLLAFIGNLFGHPPERLADDPQQAAEQYNGRIHHTALMGHPPGDQGGDQMQWAEIDPMNVPLIAYDRHLDQLQLGLIDCPDIQTGFASLHGHRGDPLEMAAGRQQRLARIGRLCSAFVVVCKLSSLHDDGLLNILTTLRDAMPGVPRMLAINKIKSRYAPATAADEAGGLIERFGLDTVYGAYDYRSSQAATRIPPPPDGILPGDEPQPIFFDLRMAADGQPLQYLFDLGQRLDSGQLAKASSRSLVMQFNNVARQAAMWWEENQQAREQQIGDARQAIAQACYEFMAERDEHGRVSGLRLQASPAILAQMADSLQQTAPAWMRFSLRIDRTARQFQQAISDSAARLKLLKQASDSVKQVAQRFRRGEGAQVVTPARLAESILAADRHESLGHVSKEKMLADCERAMLRFAAENQTLLDPQALQAWSAQVWRDMSWRDKLWKGTQPLAVLMAPFLAVVLIPFDAGGTAVLVFASAKELLAAAGLAALLGPVGTGGETLSIIHRETPWRQLSDLFAITCDSLGVPRPAAVEHLPALNWCGTSRQLVTSPLETKMGAPPPALTRWQMSTENRQQLAQSIGL